MLFWIIIVLIIAATAYAIWQGYDWVDGIPVLFLTSIAGLVILFLAAVFIPCNVDLVNEKTTSLKALGTSSKVQGKFFLGSGYVDGKRVLNYIQQGDDGGMRVAQVDAKDALIFRRLRQGRHHNEALRLQQRLDHPMAHRKHGQIRIPDSGWIGDRVIHHRQRIGKTPT